MREQLKVVLVTMDEPYYIPKYIEDILNKLTKNVEVVKIYATPPNLKKESFMKTVHGFFSYFGIIVFSYMVILNIFYKASDFINTVFNITTRFHSVKLVCSKLGIPFQMIDSINSKNILDELRELDPDIIFSVACPQIFSKDMISIPSSGSLNIHSSLLPLHRGLNANFWVLAKGEEVTGVTIHYLNPGIDDGDILTQEKIIIEKEWSLNDLYLKVIEVGSHMISKTLDLIYEDKIMPQENDISKGSYNTFPTRTDVKEFRARNKRFFKYY